MAEQWPSDEKVQRASSDLTDEAVQSSTIFVRGLSYDVMDEQLHSYFEEVGPVKHAFVAKEKPNNTSRGFGFVEFAVASDAEEAVKRFHNTMWMGRKLNIQIALSKDAQGKSRTEVKEEKLKEERREKNRKNREEKARFKAELREAGIDLKPKSDVSDEIIALNDGRVLIITGLNDTVQEDRLLASCRRVAPVQKVIFPSVESRDNSLAARVFFETKEAAVKAAKKFNEKDLRGCKVKAFILEGKTAAKAARLIVRNISFKTTEDELVKLFSKFGPVGSVNLPKSDNGAMRGFAFVQMSSVEDAEKAILGTNGTELHKRPIAVDWSLPKTQYDRMTYFEKLKEANGGVLPVKKEKAAEQATSDEAAQEKMEDDDDTKQDAEDEDAEEGADEDDEAEEDNEEDEGDDDEDEDDDEDNGDEDDEEEEEEEEKKVEKKEEKKLVKSTDVHKGSTIFIRNLSYDTTEDELHNKFAQYGRIKVCKIVKDTVLNRSMGTAFVQFHNVEDAEHILRTYGADSQEDLKKVKKTKFKKSVKAVDDVIRLDGRDLIIARAVDRHEAKRLEETNKTKKEDRRNLYLSKEGLILPDTPAAEGLSKEDLEKRQRAWKEKREKLKNPNYFISNVRLSVRNIPLDMDDKELKKIFRDQVMAQLKAAGKKCGSVTITQAKIVRDHEKHDLEGNARSKGYGFVEFSDPEHSLIALRAINNNPTIFSKTRRPIIEFALDDVRKLMVRDKYKSSTEQKKQKVEEVRKQAEQAALAALGHSVNATDLKKVFEDSAASKKRKSRDDGGKKFKKQRA